jgi:hypothetical protein
MERERHISMWLYLLGVGVKDLYTQKGGIDTVDREIEMRGRWGSLKRAHS